MQNFPAKKPEGAALVTPRGADSGRRLWHNPRSGAPRLTRGSFSRTRLSEGVSCKGRPPKEEDVAIGRTQ